MTATWIVSHSQQSFITFSKSYAKDISLKSIVFRKTFSVIV